MKKCSKCHELYSDELEQCPQCKVMLEEYLPKEKKTNITNIIEDYKTRTKKKITDIFKEYEKGIISCALIGAFLLGFGFKSCTGISKADYRELEQQKDNIINEKTNLKEEYNKYKVKMQPYEEQQQADEKAADEKRAAEEKARKEADEKAAAEKAAQEAEAKKQKEAAEREKVNTATQNSSEPSSMVIAKDYKPTGKEPDWIALVSYCEVQMPKVIGYDANISLKDEDTRIIKTGHRYKIETDLLKLKADKSYHKATFILEFDDNYENYRVDSAEVDGIKFR